VDIVYRRGMGEVVTVKGQVTQLDASAQPAFESGMPLVSTSTA
jgi:hypothetical protein